MLETCGDVVSGLMINSLSCLCVLCCFALIRSACFVRSIPSLASSVSFGIGVAEINTDKDCEGGYS